MSDIKKQTTGELRILININIPIYKRIHKHSTNLKKFFSDILTFNCFTWKVFRFYIIMQIFFFFSDFFFSFQIIYVTFFSFSFTYIYFFILFLVIFYVLHFSFRKIVWSDLRSLLHLHLHLWLGVNWIWNLLLFFLSRWVQAKNNFFVGLTLNGDGKI